jgi:hypothetical protein
MAQPTAIDDKPSLVKTSGAEQAIALSSDREYSVAHLGLDDAGNSDTALVFCAVEGIVSPDLMPDGDKLVLRSPTSVTIGPGVNQLRFRAAGGTPLLQIIPGAKRQGAW